MILCYLVISDFMMKLSNLLLICAYLSDICCVTPYAQVLLKKQDLSEKPLFLTTKRNGNNDKLSLFKLTSKPQANQISITPDIIMPQPLNLRLNNNYKPTHIENHSKKQDIGTNKKVPVLPIDKIQPTVTPARKQNQTDNHYAVITDIPKIQDQYGIYNNKGFYIDIDENNDFNGDKSIDTKLDQVDYKVTEYRLNRTTPDSQSDVTGTKASDIKPNTTSDRISIKNEKRLINKVLKTITNAVESIVSNKTYATKINSERTKADPIANQGKPDDKMKTDQNDKPQNLINIMPRLNVQSHGIKPIVHDNVSTTKVEVNVYPDVMRSLSNDPKDKIVIKNNDYEEVFERSNSGSAVNSCKGTELLNDNVDQENTNQAYIPDITFIKLPYEFPLDKVDHLRKIKTDDALQVEYSHNDETSRDRIWRTWKNTEIHIQANAIEHNASNRENTFNPYKATDTTFANQMKPAICSCYSPHYGRYYYPVPYYSYYNQSYLYRYYR